MKKLLLASFLFICSFIADAQRLIVDSTKFIGGSNGFTTVERMKVTSDGGMVIVGTSLANGAGDIPSFPYGNYNIFVAKLNAQNNLQWVKLFGGSQDDWGKDIAETADGGFVIMAMTQSHDGDVTKTYGSDDVLLIKLDANGNKQWSNVYGGPGDDQPVSLAVTADGTILLMGNANYSGNDIPFHYSTSPFVFDWFLMKISPLGDLQWCKIYGGDGDEDIGGSILLANNAYYVVGSSSSTNHDCTDTSWHPHGQTRMMIIIF